MVQSMMRVPQVVQNISTLRALEVEQPGNASTHGVAADELEVVRPGENPALDRWNQTRLGGAT